jgi:phosphate transport system substrate-binding protein
MKVTSALAILALAACTRDARVIDGAGASLPYPLYSKWATEYSGARVNYQPLGSGAGVRQVSDGVVDFGATDLPMSDVQLKEAHADLVHLPMTIGAVVIAFHVDGVKELRLTREVVGDVFRGTITKWNDARIAAENPDASLPDASIAVVRRADGSGTSAAFTSYLASYWGDPATKLAGVGVRGNDGVAGYVKNTPNAIGYLELVYAHKEALPIALVKNRAGRWMHPDLDSLERAARSAIERRPIPDDLRISIVDSEDEDAYPIAALSFIVLPRDAKERTKAEALRSFVWWGLHDGQRYAAALDYAPLPSELVARAEVVVKSLRAEGKPL